MAVSRAIRLALERISKQDRDLGKLLSTAIKTGADRTFCYTHLRIEPFAMPAETRSSLDPLVTKAG